ncbi:MAG TPA: ABC transporter substrate-binding protein [Candidatus Binatia bacterium]|jgi:ABC-type nitrate/sulfonate/bicarbonate transport system substrate-binding protein|nr:ABC transporter substrate-binding protein [Candidatus Binatia bacterium]
MSTLDQPILIANSNYHVGHQIAIFVAEEQGFFSDEGLKEFEYDSRGLIPGPIEREGLAMAIKNHGVDIAPAVDVEAAIYQRSLGADVYIVGGWRYTPFLKWYGAKHLTDMSKLLGGRIGMREKEGLVEVFIRDALRQAGVDPYKEVQWVYDPVFGYRNNPSHMEMLRSGKIDAITSQPPFADQLEREGYPMILDPNKIFPRRPGKLTIATGQMIEKRSDELKAYFRAIIRAFWFMRDVKNFEYLKDLEARLRRTNTHNEDEHGVVAIVTSPDRVESWALPIDGGVAPSAIERIVDEMVKRGKLTRSIPVKDILRDEPVKEAYREVSARPELKSALNIALAAQEKYGF